MYLLQFGGARPDYQHFLGAPAALETVSGIVSGAMRFDAQSVIGFGILLLIATPICRVIFGVVGFAVLRDRVYTAVSAVVLVIVEGRVLEDLSVARPTLEDVYLELTADA